MKLQKIVVTTLLACPILTISFLVQFPNSTNVDDMAFSQESSDCFMINSRGQRINLNSLCNSSSSSPQTGSASQAATQSPPTKIEANGTLKIKIKRRIKGIPILDVVFNGNRTYEMMLDTGASRTLITSEMAQSLNVVPYNYANFTIADGSTVRFSIGEVKSVEVGSLKKQLMPVAIAIKSDIGLLGNDFFEQFDIKIGRNEIELSPHQLF